MFWDHADHECSPECCKQGHFIEGSATELEASLSPIEILVEEEMNNKDNIYYNFIVKVRQKTETEIEELDGEEGEELDGTEK